jgi:hypothetical protein
MAEPLRYKKVKVYLDREYVTNGKALIGEVEVTAEQAEDLERRKATYRQYESSLVRDNGKQIHAQDYVGNGQ